MFCSPVELAKVDDGEPVNGDSACTVVLDDFVLGSSSTSTDDLCVAIALEGESILADSGPPTI